MNARLFLVPATIAGAWFAADTVNAVIAARNVPEPGARAAPPVTERTLDATGVTIPGFGDGAEIASAACPASLTVLSALGVVDRPELAMAAIRWDGVIGVVQQGDTLAGLPVERVHVGDDGIAEVELRTSGGLVACRAAERGGSTTTVAALSPGVISRAVVQKIIQGDMTEAWAGIRVVPYFEGGTPLGFKLYGVKEGSLVASLGAKNGDVIRAVNGIDLNRPGDVFGAYGRLKDEDEFVFDVLRGGKAETLRVEVR